MTKPNDVMHWASKHARAPTMNHINILGQLEQCAHEPQRSDIMPHAHCPPLPTCCCQQRKAGWLECTLSWHSSGQPGSQWHPWATILQRHRPFALQRTMLWRGTPCTTHRSQCGPEHGTALAKVVCTAYEPQNLLQPRQTAMHQQIRTTDTPFLTLLHTCTNTEQQLHIVGCYSKLQSMRSPSSLGNAW